MTESSDYLKACKEQMLSRCQYLKKTVADDECYYRCKLNECHCIIEYGSGECEEWDGILEEELIKAKTRLILDRKVKTVIQSNKEDK